MKVIANFYRYVFRHPVFFTGYLLLTLIAKSVESLQPFFFKWITASVTSGNYSQAQNYVLWLLLALFIGTITYTFSWFLGDRGVIKSAADLQMDVMKQIHALDFAYHTEKSSGKLISLMKRGEDAFFNMFDIINQELLSVLISFGFMIFAFSSLGPKYIAISLVTIIVSAIGGAPFLKLNLKRRHNMNDAEDRVTAARVDNLINFDTVKYFAKESYEQSRLSSLLDNWNKAAQSYLNTFRYLDLSIGNLSNLALTGTIFISVLDLQSGKISVPDFVLVTSFSASFFPKLVHVVMVFRNGAKRFSDLKAYFDVLYEKVTVKDPDSPVTIADFSGKIDFNQVRFSYHQKNPVFKNFSLTINPGESVALVGLSGSGKTTLIKLLMRMYDINGGQILIDGVNIAEVSKSYLRSLISIVPQDPLMFNHSLRYNVSYANPELPDSEVWHALELAKLADFAKGLPDKLDTPVGERGIKLSGGQRQRLAIARVLLEKSKIIVLDEATSSLDSESEGVVQDAFWSLVKDPHEPRTSIIIAHRLSTVMRSDRIIVLDKGRMVEEGNHKDLIKKPKGLYSHLWHLQQNGFLAAN